MKHFFIILCCIIGINVKGQVLFYDSFGTSTLSANSYTLLTSQGVKTVTTTYSNIPSSYNLINDNYKNNAGSVLSPNKPFNITTLKYDGWALAYSESVNDTFLVSTSWLDSTTTTNVNRYVVTPAINGIGANTILSWEAMSPDASFPDGYQVLVTTNTSASLTANDFNVLPVFSISDGNTSGGGEKSTWTKRGVSLSAYAGQNIRVAFKNNSKNMYQLWIDDIKLETASNALDAEITEGQPIYKYGLVNTNNFIRCRITNKGPSTINTFTLNYSVDNGSVLQQLFNITLNTYNYSDIVFNTPYSSASTGWHSVKIWVSSVNGFSDPNKLNDTLYSSISLMATQPAKNTLVEQFLDASDGYSPDAQQKLIDAVGTSTSVIQVNIHDNDSLKVSSVSNLISDYRKKTSTALIDRNYFYDINSATIDRNDYSTRISQRNSAVVPVAVSVTNMTFNPTSRVLDFTVQASFSGEAKGDFRVISYLTENSVYGPAADTTLNGWNQLNFLYNTPWSPFYQVGNLVASSNNYVMDAFQYKHKWVLDFALDGAYGTSGIIPTTGGTMGQSYTKAYSFTIPTSTNGAFRYNPDNMYIVSFVAEYDSDKNKRTILNCTQQKLTGNPELVSVKELKSNKEFELFPNPSSGGIFIVIPEQLFKDQPEIVVTDLTGKIVYSTHSDIRFGIVQLKLDQLENGAYFMTIGDDQTRITKKLIISH